jgi:hypothetical protein
MVKALYLLAVMLTAIALGAGLAHLIALPNKIGLGADDYLTVQRNYDNWWIVGLNWEELRAQWEYSHALRAILYVLALGALVLSVLDWRSAPGR